MARREGCFAIHIGMDNICTVNPNHRHLFLDCDQTPLNKLLHSIFTLVEAYPELSTTYVLASSPWNFHVANFASLPKETYFKIRNEALELKIVSPEYIHQCILKQNSVLRLGRKHNYPIRPAFRIDGYGEECLKDCAIYFKLLKHYQVR